MSSRDHPFNRSTRPLLMERKPQLLLKKRNDTKVHGFNDFDIMSQQYKNFNTHIGYPYGSPPSPTMNPDSFAFSDSTNNFYKGSPMDDSQANAWNRSPNFDEFGWTKHQTNLKTVFAENNGNSGPFIFGVHNANTFAENSKTVINETKTYSVINGQKLVLNQQNSDHNIGRESKFREKPTKGKTKDKLSRKKENRPKIKCVLVGDGAVGKTSLIVTYLENRFVQEHVPTASDIYNAEVMVNDSPVRVTLCDTAGQDNLDPLRELCYPDSDVFLLCFSVIKPDTFRSIKTKWAPKFTKTRAALVLVGTQADLRTDPHVLNKLQIQGEKPTSFADAWDLATSIGAKYVETSSFTQEKVKDVFDTAIWEALLSKHLPPPVVPLWKRLFCLA